MKNYIDWYRNRRKSEPDRAVDWVGKALILDEFFYESFNQEPLKDTNHAGGMSYNQREDLWQHQNADVWIIRWKSRDIYKKFKLDLMQWFELPYPEAEWLLKRAAEEDAFIAKRREEAKQENPGDGELPDLGDMADAFGNLGEED